MNIVIVEDEEKQRALLQRFLHEFFQGEAIAYFK